MEIKCCELWFWGKILGLEKAYFVAAAIFYEGNFQFPLKKYYFCNSVSYIFTELPEIGQEQIQDALKFNTYFVGNPDIILEKYVDNSGGEPYQTIPNSLKSLHPDLAKQDLYQTQVSKKNFTGIFSNNSLETDRLSYVVRRIDNDTNVVPEGAFKMLPIHELRRNDNFTGTYFYLE